MAYPDGEKMTLEKYNAFRSRADFFKAVHRINLKKREDFLRYRGATFGEDGRNAVTNLQEQMNDLCDSSYRTWQRAEKLADDVFRELYSNVEPASDTGDDCLIPNDYAVQLRATAIHTALHIDIGNLDNMEE